MATNKFEGLKTALTTGALIGASRKELENYAMLVCLPGATNVFPGQQWLQVAEMVRLLLLVRISEETQNKAIALARAAVIIATGAALFTATQLLAAVGLIKP